MLPTRSLGIISPTGGEQMQMGVVLPIAPMGVEHRDVTPSECLAPDGAVEIIQALPPTAHERAQHDRRVLVKGRAEHRRHRQDDMPIDDARVDRKSTRLNSSHSQISYAVFCLKKKKKRSTRFCPTSRRRT